MRLSTLRNDRGYKIWQAINPGLLKIKVFLNGVEVKDCDMADEELGILTKAKLNADGHMYIEPGTDLVASETLYGNVKIQIEVRS